MSTEHTWVERSRIDILHGSTFALVARTSGSDALNCRHDGLIEGHSITSIARRFLSHSRSAPRRLRHAHSLSLGHSSA